ncbi:T9SS type A sorting domain-containing protein [Gilvibacter sp.]|uniref:T9SS type A sorting domain-containing protein n=1 Tax=Gilvibacter sp. TaxID=2729997 RepID=UPI0025BB5AF3|nr:T9SS type A sorting domain-containing protein [Gilvibacter sp.]NQX76392.1 T9SS type A sorting domain-containing protein [Gilvibacter sp.]
MKKISPIFLLLLISFSLSAQDHTGVSYGPEDRQFLDIWIAPSSMPTPVFVYAHPNGGTTDLPGSITDDLKDVGISVVSWESITSLTSIEDVETTWADAELMFEWLEANADTYNFDLTNMIIGGSSRGTIVSWIYGHRPNPNVKGLYMYNALPDGIWADPSWWLPTDEVSIDSPPIFFVYRFEPGTEDIHDPENGIIITEAYDALGIGDRHTLVHSIEYSGNTDRFQFLVDFALSVITPLSVEEQELGGITLYPNPVAETLNFETAANYQSLRIYSAMGQLILRSDYKSQLDVSVFSSGTYIIELRDDQGRLHRDRFIKY